MWPKEIAIEGVYVLSRLVLGCRDWDVVTVRPTVFG